MPLSGPPATLSGAAASNADAIAGTDTSKYLTPAAGNARALHGDLTRKVSAVLFSDGATSGRRAEATPGSVGNVAGMATTFAGNIPKIASNPTSNVFLFYLGPNGSTAGSADDNALVCFIGTSGQLILSQRGAAGTYRLLSLTNYVSTYGQKRRSLVVSLAGDSTDDPLIALDGINLVSSFTPGSSTPPNWMHTGLLATKFLNAFLWIAGEAPLFTYGLGIWTAAEALDFAQTGQAPSWWLGFTGSAVPAYTSDFSAGVDTFTADAPTVITGNVDGINGSDNWLSAERTVSSGPVYSRRSSIPAFSMQGPRAVLLEARIYIPAGSPITHIQFYWNNGVSGARGTPFAVTADTEYVLRQQAVLDKGNTLWGVAATDAGGASATSYAVSTIFYQRDTRVYSLGPVIKLGIQPGGVILSDFGSNRISIVLTAGMTAAGDKPEVISVLGQQMTADGFVLADQIITPEGYELIATYVERLAGSGTGTLTIKETSSGGTTVATGAIASGTVSLTVSNGLSASAKKLHVANSSWSSTTIQLRFTFRRFK